MGGGGASAICKNRGPPFMANRGNQVGRFCLVCFSTGTFCPHVWELLSGSMHEDVEQHYACRAVVEAFTALICMRQLILLDA